MKIFKTQVFTETAILICDTVFWKGKYWIVPEWLENKVLKKQKPKRIILLDNYEDSQPGLDHHFHTIGLIPRDILFGQLPKKIPFYVIEYPEVELDIPEILY